MRNSYVVVSLLQAMASKSSMLLQKVSSGRPQTSSAGGAQACQTQSGIRGARGWRTSGKLKFDHSLIIFDLSFFNLFPLPTFWNCKIQPFEPPGINGFHDVLLSHRKSQDDLPKHQRIRAKNSASSIIPYKTLPSQKVM